jgi:hypothetical protein
MLTFKYTVTANNGETIEVLWIKGRRYVENCLPCRMELITEEAYANIPGLLYQTVPVPLEDLEVDIAQSYVTFDCLGITAEQCLTAEALHFAS